MGPADTTGDREVDHPVRTPPATFLKPAFRMDAK
jgi:hypothetical protein